MIRRCLARASTILLHRATRCRVLLFERSTIADFNASLLGRNTFFLDGTKRRSTGLTKTFSMPWEGHKVIVRARHVQCVEPRAVWFSKFCDHQHELWRHHGVATLYQPRNIQVSLRYQY